MQKESLQHRKTFTWENLNYHVPSANGPLRLLHDVQGYVKPGTLTALMGASGAGRQLSQSLHLVRLKSTIQQAKPLALMFSLSAKTSELLVGISWLTVDL